MKANRIQELAEQAEEWNADGDKCEVNLQKFAELIIADCAKLCEPAAQPERPQNCGSGFCSCIECVMEPEQEPVACVIDGDLYFHHEIDWEDLAYQGHGVELLYAKPPKRPWVELNDEQYIKIADETFYAGLGFVAFARAIDAKLKELNHD